MSACSTPGDQGSVGQSVDYETLAQYEYAAVNINSDEQATLTKTLANRGFKVFSNWVGKTAVGQMRHSTIGAQILVANCNYLGHTKDGMGSTFATVSCELKDLNNRMLYFGKGKFMGWFTHEEDRNGATLAALKNLPKIRSQGAILIRLPRELAQLPNTSKTTPPITLPTPNPPPPLVKKKPKTNPSPPTKSGSIGSGLFVSKLGHLITNEHVVRDCRSVTVGDNAKKQVTVTVVETDKRTDLALLKISTTDMASADTKSLISKLSIKIVPLASWGLLRSDDVELGERVLVAGYPYGEIFSSTVKVTLGIVSAIRGMGDDSGQFQLDAAVQAGNSGGPIYDENGNIVGVVVAQLNKLKVAKAIGSLPENVNFGIKASTVRQFLTSSGLPTKWSTRSRSMSTKNLAKIAKNQTVMVVCHR